MELIWRYGNDAQKAQWLTPLLAGEIRSVFGMTEPAVASSDATNMQATAIIDGDEVVINGRKWWSTGIGHPNCKILIFMGLTDPTAEKHRQHSMVLVPIDAQGVKIERMLPVFSSFDEPSGHGEVSFTNVRVPISNIIAGAGRGFEIAPRDFIFRVRELEQMEIEYFVRPEQWEEIFENLYTEQQDFLKEIGLDTGKLHKVVVPDADRAHYSKHSIDTEFDFPFGQKELLGLAYRTDFDLDAHMKASGVDISYFDESETDPEKKRLVPHCIEPTFGVGRLFLAVLSSAYREDNLGDEPRAYLKLSPKVAPILVAVSPLLKNKPQLVEKAREVYATLRKEFPGRVVFDDNGNIGKRYRRQDEIGTPFCVVIDFDTVEGVGDKKDTVTIRHRDTGEQERVSIEGLLGILYKSQR
jgi:glycyl-tRNA synthetase (class II)